MPESLVFHYLAIALYLGAFLLWVRSLLVGEEKGGRILAPLVATVGVACHLGAIASFWLRWGQAPLAGLGPALSSLSLVVGLGLLVLAALGEPARMGIVLLPFMVLLEGAAVVIGVEPSATPLDFRGFWFAAHVFLAFVGYAGMAVAFAAGLLYLVQFRELKTKRLGRLFRFIPPLATLDRIGRVGLWTGFASLTVALSVGWAWIVRYRDHLPASDPKIIWGMATWAVFIVVLGLRRFGGERPERRGALAAVWGFGLVVFSFVILRLLEGGGASFL